MANEKPKFLGLDWQTVDLNDLQGSIKAWCDDRRNLLTGLRYFILIQDRDGGGYEVIQNNKAWPLLRKVSLGYVSVYLKRKYGQSKVAANVNVWISTDDHTFWKQELENAMLGQWANKEAEAVRARKVGEWLSGKPDRQEHWLKTAPDALAWLKENNYC
ncbi:hypothetical protein FDI21_gp009 [Pseudomonas phage Noxifer]|uniref:Uncharacterized protein n=1 Tax=Pseudomonas phage Noxifer TaxID=2006684 RepID=A0A1Y0SUW0_9CAUD|nr:hypothetical protein FDI21_gp009 [Pseudomonas phage Noxifer]ARV77180.1 hypothetical protein NOXIFER_9 [Pseudomonas phage Noxifer]